MHINKTYLVWLVYWLLFNQHYQHHTNQKLRCWAYAVFQNRGVCGQAFPFLPSPSPVIPCFLLSSQLSRWTHAETLAMQVMVTRNLRKLITLFVLGGKCVTNTLKAVVSPGWTLCYKRLFQKIISLHGTGWWHDQRSRGLLIVVSLPSKRSIGPGKNTHQ